MQTESAVGEGLDLRQIYQQHADYVWRTLGRFGVPERDLPDQTQEVFVIVHRQRFGFRRESALTTWLFAIARRVAAGYRRRAYNRREAPQENPAQRSVSAQCPEQATEHSRARTRMLEILERMSLDQRAVFVMYEIDGLSGAEIAEQMGCPLQTVFSRLRRARGVFEREVERIRAQDVRKAAQ